MNPEKLLREYDYGMFLQQPKLPAWLDGDIHLLEFNSDRSHAAAWFFCLLDELQDAHDKNPQGPGGGFILSRNLLLEAWHQNRLFGLYMSETDSLLCNYRDSDAYVMTKTVFGTVKYIFPVFCIVDAAGAKMAHTKEVPADEDKDGCIECLWVAERARMVGLGQRLVAELNCYAVEYPIVPLFWNKMGYTVNPGNAETRKVHVGYS